MNVKSIMISVMCSAALGAIAVPVYATPGNQGGGNGGCGVGQQTNGCGGNATGGSVGDIAVTNKIDYDSNIINAPVTSVNARNDVNNDVRNNINNANVNNVRNDNNNANINNVRNDVTNTNTNANVNTNNNNSFAGATSDSTSAAVSGSVSSAVTGDSSAVSDQAQSQSTENNITVEGDRYERQVATAYAAPLVAGEDTCMGSTSVGGQGAVFGLSFGTTWKDKNCMRLKNSRQLHSMGYTEAAIQLVCLDKDVRKSMEAAGTPCTEITSTRK